jgi:hypothetical protein
LSCSGRREEGGGENRDQITKDFDTEQVKREKYIRERIAVRGYERTKSI